MAKDEQWIAVYEVVLEAIADGGLLQDPPTTEDEVRFLAETISDHIVGAFKSERRQ
jgi:hypothetical protein